MKFQDTIKKFEKQDHQRFEQDRKKIRSTSLYKEFRARVKETLRLNSIQQWIIAEKIISSSKFLAPTFELYF